MKGLIQKAKDFAYKMHEGQKRKEGIPFITHPAGVVKILQKEGVTDEVVLSVAWLHDTIEDTAAKYEDLESMFGKTIADKVRILSRDGNRQEYNNRIKNSDYTVKIVKIADTLHNIHNPYSFSYLSEKARQRKIQECNALYIPLAMNICPSIGYQLIESIDNYLKIIGGKKKMKTLEKLCAWPYPVGRPNWPDNYSWPKPRKWPEFPKSPELKYESNDPTDTYDPTDKRYEPIDD